jgi:glycine/D-amino acid oxidase-like deaminating enzyme
MSPPVDRISGDERPPPETEVVVVGGGIVGVATAYELAKRGTSVVVLEKGIVAGEQSSRNWGWCRQQNRDPREIALSQLSLRLWRGLNASLGEETGFRQTGLVYATSSDGDLAQWERWGETARPMGVETRMLTGAEVAALLPGNAKRWKGGVHSPTDGRAEPAHATPALARGATRHGAIIVESCAVREIERQAGRISGVVTEHGRMRCAAVVVAGGAWSRMFLHHHGLRLQQASVKSTSFFTEPARPVTEGGISMQDVTLRRRLDGGYTVGLSGQGQLHVAPWGILQAREFWRTFRMRRRGLTYTIGRSFIEGPEAFARWGADSVSPFERVRTLDPAPDAHLVAKGIERLVAAYPSLAGIRPAHAWGGFVDMTPDAIPVIAPITSRPGLFVATGFSGHGFGVGPGAGMLMADLVRGDTPSVDPKPFRYERMIDGTDLGEPGMI